MRVSALCLNQLCRLLVERQKSFGAEPGTLERDHAIREITAGLQHSESGLRRRPVDRDIAAVDEAPKDVGDIRRRVL